MFLKSPLAPYNCINFFRKSDKKLFVIAQCQSQKKEQSKLCPDMVSLNSLFKFTLSRKVSKKVESTFLRKIPNCSLLFDSCKANFSNKQTKKKQTDVDVEECNVHPSFSWSILNDHQQIQSNVFNLRGRLSKL